MPRIDGRLRGKVALITGAARGQGAAHARLFAAEGASVVIADILDDDGVAVAAELGPAAQYCHLDVGDPAQWPSAVDFTVATFGGLDILVTNAGLNVGGSIEDASLEDFAAMVNTNQLGCWYGIKCVIAPMRSRGGGSIVAIGSVASLHGVMGKAAYVGTKHAVRGIMKSAASELGEYGIRVNAVYPGGIDTPMTKGVLAPDRFDGQAIARIGRPDEVAEAVLFLASDASSYCTGTEILVDGGLSATPLPGPPAPESRGMPSV
jgi:3alpha(or 20beta)-hydroxysteroid dehydrogenase